MTRLIQRRLRKRYVNILPIIVFFLFGISLDSQWSQHITGSLGLTRYLHHASHEHHGNVPCFVKALKFRGEINK